MGSKEVCVTKEQDKTHNKIQQNTTTHNITARFLALGVGFLYSVAKMPHNTHFLRPKHELDTKHTTKA